MKKIEAIGICNTCGQEYHKKSNSQKYCGDKCKPYKTSVKNNGPRKKIAIKAKCQSCGKDYIKTSNVQRYCTVCGKEIKLKKKRDHSMKKREKDNYNDKTPLTLGPHLPKNPDWDTEARKVKNEIKRTFKPFNNKMGFNYDTISKHEIGLKNTYYYPDNEYKDDIYVFPTINGE
jgi:hypothetical protein